jgi:hypothetical protein
MKAIASLAAVVLLVALPAAARPGDGQSAAADDGARPLAADGVKQPDGTVGATAIDPKDSPLVRASKAARAASAARPKPIKPIKVITNDDVRKSPGKLSMLPPRPGIEPAIADEAAAPATMTPDMREKQLQERERKDRQSQQVVDLKKTTAELESALNLLEDEYYQSDDPSYRDEVIQKRFSATRRKLEKSREDLTRAERALEGESSPAPTASSPLSTGNRAEAKDPHDHS